MTTHDLGPEARLVRSELPFQLLADETIVVHPRTHEVHVLNETGSRLWALLATERAIGELLATLAAEFDAPAERLREETLRFLSELVGKRLVLVRGARGGAGDDERAR